MPSAERVYYQVPHIHIVLFFNYAWLYGRPTGNNDVRTVWKTLFKNKWYKYPTLREAMPNAAEQP